MTAPDTVPVGVGAMANRRQPDDPMHASRISAALGRLGQRALKTRLLGADDVGVDISVGRLSIGALVATLTVATLALIPLSPAAVGHTPTALRALPVAATTHYVATTGSDTNAGTSASPWRTIQHAVDVTPAGGVVDIATGSYSSFTVSTPDVTVAAAPSAVVTVVGHAGVRDVILVNADDVTISGLAVAGCVPNPAPSGRFESNGSSGVRINDGADGVVLTGLTIRDSHGIDNDHLPFGCYGVFIHNAQDATVINSKIYHNGYGVFVDGAGQGTVITGNIIHDNDVLIRNSVSPTNDDYGAVGIGFEDSSGSSATNNQIYNNVGSSHDWGTDGGAFEIYDASNTAMNKNTIYNNENIMETGAASGGTCANNTFNGNTATGETTGSKLIHSVGLILRCANNMTIQGNTFSSLNWWTFWIYNMNTIKGGVAGLRITGNTVNQNYDQVFDVTTPMSLTGIGIQSNSYSFKGAFATDWTQKKVSESTLAAE
jgi:parallel beta-helix repeat protein